MKRWIGLALHLTATTALAAAEPVPPGGPWLPGPRPGPAAVIASADAVVASNAVFAARWARDAKTGWFLASLANGPAAKTLAPPPHELFALTLGDGTILRASALRAGTPRVENVPAAPAASCFARRQPGRRAVIPFTSATPPLDLEWSALLRDDATYAQPGLRIRARGAAVIREATLWSLSVPGAEVVGQVDGSPVIVQNAFFLALESPNAQTRADSDEIVFHWRADNVHTGTQTVSVPLDAARLVPGVWTADFRYQSGPHRLDIRSVALLRNGAEVSRDAHDGYAGLPNSKNLYRLTVDRADPAAAWVLALEIGGTESPLNSVGEVAFRPAPIRLACLGDSITFGMGIPDRERNSYPAQLQTLLGGGVDVRNFGVSGRTLLQKGDHPYRAEAAWREALDWKPDWVVIKFGSNDSKPQNWSQAAEFDGDYRALLAELRQANPAVKIWLCTPAPAFPGSGTIREDVVHGEIVPRVKALAAAETTGLIDLHAALEGRPALFPDAVHPNRDGAALMAAAVRDAVAGGLPSGHDRRRVVASLPFDTTLAAGEELSVSSAAGLALPGQLRRSFLYYVERERAHPWRPYLHYNSWFDLSWGGYPMSADACVEAVRLFGENLIRPYGVQFDGFVLDDGWDDPATLWGFNARFPNGFTPIAAAARTYGAALGAWLSPFGGYGGPKEERLAYGRRQGYETNPSGFSMSGPKYYARFRDICRELIRTANVDYFKFDGLGGGSRVSGSQGVYLRDTEAMRRLMLELRETRPDLFINLTTGSWPSPFWLWYADSLWRQGHDTSFAGVGPRQQQWLTYRDGETYHSVVRRAPLYPISSLMSHGIIFSRHGDAADPTFTSDGLRDDIRDYFGSGTCLQELYLQPQRLQPPDWKNLAEAIRWSQSNNDLFPDTHWIGGDPLKLEVYGWAYWSPRKGAFTLRNPSDQPQTFAVRLADIFELPAGAPGAYRLTPVWTTAERIAPIRANAGETVTLTLRPFEILTFDAWPT